MPSPAYKWLIQSAARGDLDGVEAALGDGAGEHLHESEGRALVLAAQNGYVPVARRLIEAGATVNELGDEALLAATRKGHIPMVRYLLEAGSSLAHPRLGYAIAFRMAALGGNAEIASLLREYGAIFTESAKAELHEYSPAVQAAVLAVGDVAGLSTSDLARQGVCPEALCVLLERHGQSEISTLLRGTQMLDTLTPDARAEMLEDLLQNHRTPETPHGEP